MLKRFVSIILGMALLQLIIGPVGAETKEKDRDVEAAAVRKKILERGVGPRATVLISLRDGTDIFGVIGEAGQDSFTLVEIPAHRPVTIAYVDVKKVRSNLKRSLNRRIVAGALGGLGGLLVIKAISH